MPGIKAIEARLDVEDVRVSAAFYAHLLELEIGTLAPSDSPQVAILSRDGIRLRLSRRDGTSASGASAACNLWLDVTGVDDLHSKLKGKVGIERGPEVRSDGRRGFELKDPDGHLVILSEAINVDRWAEREALELWKYFGGVGGGDKNTMITVETLLLGFSAGLLGYIVTNLLCSSSFTLTDPWRGASVALLGLAISVLAAYVCVVYAGYSNWNWAQADAIARDQARRDSKWEPFLPEKAEAVREKWEAEAAGKKWKQSRIAVCALKRGKPCLPTKELPPIFHCYLWIAVSAAVIHLLLALLALRPSSCGLDV